MRDIVIVHYSHQLGGGAPLKQINTRACDLSDRSKKREERRKKNGNNICLTSYTAWWYRIEKEERKFYKEVEKDNMRREEMKKRLEEKREKKESFVKKFFPTCESSPGGTQRLVNIKKSTDVNSTGERDVGKVMARSSYLFSANVSNLNLYNSRTVTQQIDNAQRKTSFEIISGGTSDLSTVEISTNHRTGRCQGDGDIRDG